MLFRSTTPPPIPNIAANSPETTPIAISGYGLIAGRSSARSTGLWYPGMGSDPLARLRAAPEHSAILLDVDGTIYQTLDLREKAHHATIANQGSIGVEIAHPGAWLQPMNADMARWYAKDDQGWFMKTPEWMSEPGFRTPGFVARPARPDIIAGRVQGKIGRAHV